MDRVKVSSVTSSDVSTHLRPGLKKQTLRTSYGVGVDLSLSHNGSFICYYSGQKFRTSDFAALGSFNIYPSLYPQPLAFSPDDSLVYAASGDNSGITVFNANTFLPVGTIPEPPGPTPGPTPVASKLAVDSTGRYLFAGYYGNSTGTIVFDTGVTRLRPTPRLQPTPRPRPTPTPQPSP